MNSQPTTGLRSRWELGLPLSVGEAAELLGLPESTLRDRLRPVHPVSQHGRILYYSPAAIENAVFGMKRRGTP